METIPLPAQDDSSGANPSSIKSEDSSPQHGSGRGSPPPNCAICLGTCRNKSFTDSCLHQFCFKCLLTWSKVKAECPLCKQHFRSIIHNVRSNHQYEEYMVEQGHTEDFAERIDIDTLSLPNRRFRYRTTLTLPRRESLAIQQLLLHYPMVADVFPPPSHARPPPARRRRSPVAFRRTVYRHNLWARPLPDFTGRFRDCTPEFYRFNDTQMHRLVPWINRELHYLLNENAGHISYVIARIVELLPQYHINSSHFREAMQRYFGDRTEHFLHELYCFASTPYDMTGYDRNVQYTTYTRISTMVNEVISSSASDASVDSDIVMVSSSEPAEPPPGPSRQPAPVYPHNFIAQPPDNVIPIETISHSDTDDDSSEVMVVGYIKPPQDRTPEVVDLLGSDSDVIVQDVAPSPTPSPLVKMSWKRHRPSCSDSDDSSYRPNTPDPPRRRRCRRSGTPASSPPAALAAPAAHAAHAAPASPAASNPPASPASMSSPPASSPTSSSDSFSSIFATSDSSVSTSSSEDRRRRAAKRKSKRKSRRETGPGAKGKRKSRKRSSRSHHRERRDSPKMSEADKDRRSSKRKSYSGKGVKSSKKSKEEPPPPPEETQAGPSGVVSRENRRLRSVVNVMYSHKNCGDSSPSGISVVNSASGHVQPSCSYDSLAEVPAPPAQPDDSDSDDDLPLNLTMQKTYFSL